MRLALAEVVVSHRDVGVAGPVQLRYEVQPQRHLMAAIVAAHLRLEGWRGGRTGVVEECETIANVIDPNATSDPAGGMAPWLGEIILQSASSSQL